jgi:hypothetical protein
MKRTVLSLIASVAFAGIAASSFAQSADEHLQPNRLEFKRKTEATGWAKSPAIEAQKDYRFLTDYGQ